MTCPVLAKELEALRLDLSAAGPRVDCLERRIAELAKTVGRERQLLVRIRAEVEYYEKKAGP